MTTTCHPVTKAVAQDMLQGVVRAICDRPGETKAQRDALTHDVVHSVMAFEPRDPVEIMLAGMAVTHFHLILDSAHDVFAEQPENLKVKTKSGVVALDRSMVGFLKELRTAQTRPMEGAAEAARHEAPAEPEASRPPKPEAEAEARQQEPAPASRQGPAADWRDAAPVPLLPPVRKAETSIAAMLAVLSPPTKPLVVDAGTKQGAARPVEGGSAGLPQTLETLTAAAEIAAGDRLQGHVTGGARRGPG